MGSISRPKVRYDDTGNLDAFCRLRVSELTTQIDIKQIHDGQPLLVDSADSALGGEAITHSTNSADTTLELGGSGEWIVQQTLQRFNYQSGKSHQILMTFSNFEAETNAEKRVGYFSSSTTSPYTASKDGLFLLSDATEVSINIFRSGNEVESTAQSAWNLDTMDGNGASNANIDWSKSQILIIDFEWLGVGRVRWGLMVDGQIIYFHESNHANSVTQVYMSSPNQPLRWEIRQTGAGSSTFKYICASVASEGSINQTGKDGGISDNGTHLDANSNATWYYAIGLRLQAAKVDTLIELVSATLKSDTNDDFEYRVCLNPTYASTVTYTDISNYAVSYGLGATANTVSGFGSILNAGYGIQQSLQSFELLTTLRLGVSLAGSLDEIVVAVRPHTSNADIHRAINWRELT